MAEKAVPVRLLDDDEIAWVGEDLYALWLVNGKRRWVVMDHIYMNVFYAMQHGREVKFVHGEQVRDVPQD